MELNLLAKIETAVGSQVAEAVDALLRDPANARALRIYLADNGLIHTRPAPGFLRVETPYRSAIVTHWQPPKETIVPELPDGIRTGEKREASRRTYVAYYQLLANLIGEVTE